MDTKTYSNLSLLLGEKKLKISKVSKSTGISRTTLTRLYYGDAKSISFDVLNRLCTFLECQPGDILMSKCNS